MANKHKHFAKKNTPINKIITMISKRKIEYVPVLDDNDKVIGVITPSSLINLLQDY